MNDTKMCRGCLMDKPLSMFARNAMAPNGHRNYCRPCWNARRRSNTELLRQRLRLRRFEWITESGFPPRGPELLPVPARFAAGIVSVLEQIRRVQR